MQPWGSTPESLTPLAYHQLHRAGRPGWWRPLLGIILGGLSIFVFSSVLAIIPFLIYLTVRGEPVLAGLERLVDIGDPDPLTLAYLNVVLASAIPITFLLQWGLHGLRPRWLTSVRPRLRWGYFGACLVAAVVALGATIVVSLLMPASAGLETDTGLNEFTDRTRDFVLVVLLLTPLQAAGEEYFFRGYLTQAFGGVIASRAVAVLGPALLFALAHGIGQSIPVFFDRFAFGVVAGILVILTGGLEAGIAMHILNNFLAFGFALAFGDLGSALNATGGSWWMIPGTLTQSLVYLGLAWGLARVMGVADRADPAVLAASSPRVYRVPSAPPVEPWQPHGPT